MSVKTSSFRLILFLLSQHPADDQLISILCVETCHGFLFLFSRFLVTLKFSPQMTGHLLKGEGDAMRDRGAVSMETGAGGEELGHLASLLGGWPYEYPVTAALPPCRPVAPTGSRQSAGLLFPQAGGEHPSRIPTFPRLPPPWSF